MDKYTFNKEIGSGSFGKVYLVESKQTGIQYVVKQIDLTKLDKKKSQSACKEVELLSKMKHNNIVRYKESYEESKMLSIVMEYCENGDLHGKIKEKRLRNETFCEVDILDYFVQICLALEYIHELRILHRDLKTKNIFLTKGNAIKLGDFGIAKMLENSFELAQTCIGSPFYISPEICENKPYNKKSDVWALGCVLYELSTLKYAFIAANVKSLITKIITGAYNPLPTNINVRIRSLISAMLRPNPKDRPTVSELLRKPFLQQFRQKHSAESRKTDLRTKRSKSVDAIKNFSFSSDKRTSSATASYNLELNGFGKFKSVTNPEMKYNAPFMGNKTKWRKREASPVKNLRKPAEDSVVEDFSKPNDSKKPSKFVKLPKADSQYYNLIAENERNEREKLEKAVENGGANLQVDAEVQVHGKEEVEARKRWTANTLDKQELIAVLAEADLINTSECINTQIFLDKKKEAMSIDDLLKLDPSEFKADVLEPHVIEHIVQESVQEAKEQDWLSLLKMEVKQLRKQYDVSCQTYPLRLLIRLTDNCKYLYFHPRFPADEVNLFFNLELVRMELEKKIGLTSFIQAYRKMSEILNRNFRLNGSETYTLSEKINLEKQAWAEVLAILDQNRIHLPDIWELVVAEQFCYEEHNS